METVLKIYDASGDLIDPSLFAPNIDLDCEFLRITIQTDKVIYHVRYLHDQPKA